MSESANRIEVIVGRSLAVCVHPVGGWRFGTGPVRAWIVLAYFSLAFATVLGALEALHVMR